MNAVFAPLSAHGLSLQAVLDVAQLPADVLSTLALTPDERAVYRRLVLIGHRGPAFWEALRARGLHGSDPVDAFVTECVRGWMDGLAPGGRWLQVFPGTRPVGLQRLGQLAGWYHPSPFWVGVDAEWGSWFAYRAVVLTDTDWPFTPRRERSSPCLSCRDQPCLGACPAKALAPVMGQADEVLANSSRRSALQVCIDHRLQPGSACQDRCLARNACPVGSTERYSHEQMAYHYLQSLPALRHWRDQRS